jgi:hypothetical protein
LMTAVALLDSLAEYDRAAILNEAPDKGRAMARLRGARGTLHALIEVDETAEVH